jgi:hypothetical protein
VEEGRVTTESLARQIDILGLRSSRLPQPRSSRRGCCAKSVRSAGSALKASDDPDKEQILRDLREDETQREAVIESLKADYEVRRGRL